MNITLPYTIEPEDPEFNRTLAQFRRNGEWMSEHGKSLYDQYPGQYVAISEGQVFASADAQEAERLASEKHPDDVPYVRYIPKARYKRIYAC